MPLKLTKTIIDETRPQEKELLIFDSLVSGFGLRVSPGGRKSFILQYRFRRSTRRLTLGAFGTMTLDQARSRAVKSLALVQDGTDPAYEKQADKTGLESELKKLDQEIREITRQSKQIVSLQDKLVLQKQRASLEKRHSQKRHDLFTAQDDMEKKRDGLIADIEKQLKSHHNVEEILRIQWRIVWHNDRIEKEHILNGSNAMNEIIKCSRLAI